MNLFGGVSEKRTYSKSSAIILRFFTNAQKVMFSVVSVNKRVCDRHNLIVVSYIKLTKYLARMADLAAVRDNCQEFFFLVIYVALLRGPPFFVTHTLALG